jgi:purine-nucleoside phosphorylase
MDPTQYEIPAATLDKIRSAANGEPIAGAVVLGSGLGTLLDSWETVALFQGTELPGYPTSTVAGHAGRVALVRWGKQLGLVFQGRVHFYEGYQRPQITFAVRLAAALGAGWMMFTNAAGSVHPHFFPGTVMVVEDHVRIFMGATGAWRSGGGPTLCGSPYDQTRTEQCFRIMAREGLRVMRGVLFGGLGPTYETAAEVEMIRRLGAHGACMSTVVEAEEAARLGMEVVAMSLITNLGTGLSNQALSHDEVVEMANDVGPLMAKGIAEVVQTWQTD